MTLPIIEIEADGELELSAALVGAIPAGTKFSVEPLTFPSNGTLPERKGFLLTQVIDPGTVVF